ncbi:MULTISPECIES: Xaa-Pro peptidase family protein [unclassified Lacticaseibacillus]|uniref:M24 family metallopeptidase n=1 Tax=unclassified Lacticaseibacillus TaxID=2759744 RepID=UPI001943A232|nr:MULTISPECIES: Xaa-Pro peptidase family protein [unclassified Lacticaseibacillus]
MSRLQNLQAELPALKVDALLVTDPVNVTYLTGFTGNESALLVAQDYAWFITDSRFTEQVKVEVHNAELVLHSHGLLGEAGVIADANGLKTLGFEADVMTYADFQKLPANVTWQATTNVVPALREVKDEDELKLIEKAIQIAEAGYQHVLDTIKPGMTELQVATDLDFYMRSLGASGTSFETIVASGKRAAMPHGAATDKKIEDGDVITLDWGCIYQGYVSDITRTFAVGEPDEKLKAVYKIVYDCNKATAAMMAPGVLGKAINGFAHQYIEDKGYGQYFGHGTGHGIGLSIHEGPGAWGPYANTPQAEGNVETDEPGIYIPDLGGVRVEDDLLITKSGAKYLTTPAPSELLVVPVRK